MNSVSEERMGLIEYYLVGSFRAEGIVALVPASGARS